MNKSIVSIVKGKQPLQMVEESLFLLGGVESLIKPRATVVIKPNAGHPYGPRSSVNTCPEMVTAVINIVKKANPKKIIVAESSAIGTDSMIYERNAGLHIVVGSKNALPKNVDAEKVILVGDCNKKFRGKAIFAGGCPPAESWIIFAIRDRKDYTEDGLETRQQYEETVKMFQEYMQKRPV